MATNQTTVVQLLSVPLENDYRHTFSFTNLSQQNTYFTSLVKFSETNLSYQRKDSVIRYPKHYDDLQECNYVRYMNNGKWYYAFINDMKYVNDERTDITIETDAMQTWLFDYTVRTSFVEREHVKLADDVPGNYTLDEGLQIGEYICNMHQKTNFGSAFMIVVGMSERTGTGSSTAVYGGVYNGLYSGLTYFAFPHTTEGINQLKQRLKDWDTAGVGDAIQMMFLLPTFMVQQKSQTDFTVLETSEHKAHYINRVVSNSSAYSTFAMTDEKLNGYTPKNKKLLCYPYRYLMVSNNNGVSVPFYFEQFKNTTTTKNPAFVIESCISPGGSVRMVPLDYKGTARNDEEGINLGKYPILNWISDAYTNWMTQNSVNVGVDIASNVLMTTIGVAGTLAAPATGGLSLATGLAAAGALTQGVSGIASTMGEIYKASKVPPQSRGNVNAGDVIAVSGENDFHFYDMTIKAEYAKMVDKFFYMYGYKVNTVKIPNKNHRPHYWYTKTIDANIIGNIPKKELQTIKNCYNNGITFWTSWDRLGDYNLDNITGDD